MKKVILTIAVAFVFAFVGSVWASPPCPPPEEGYVISTTTAITCVGTTVEKQSFTDTHAFQLDAAADAGIAGLDENETISRIRYEEEYRGYGGFTVFNKDFDAKSHDTPNLEVDKAIGYVSNGVPGSVASFDERVAIEVVSAGTDIPAGPQFAGLLAMCPWATVGDGFPATNEGVAMGSSFSVNAGGSISVLTHTDAEVTENVALAYGINAVGANATVSAGMLASLWEGSTTADPEAVLRQGRQRTTQFLQPGPLTRKLPRQLACLISARKCSIRACLQSLARFRRASIAFSVPKPRRMGGYRLISI